MAFQQPQSGQMSDSVFVMIPLTLSGGLQDAYSYFMRDRVFANAQTGNIVLMSHALFSRDLSGCLRYLLPVLAFALGVMAANFIRSSHPGQSGMHWRQTVLAAEILLLAAVGFMPSEWNWLANALTSFSCAMQVQSFRSVDGSSYASTMCIGNLRSGMDHLSVAIRDRDWNQFQAAGRYGMIILLFAFSAGGGSLLTQYMGMKTIWVSCGLLMAGCLLMVAGDSPQ
jgi:uncharacterized membrane protein YoaK (UPF0700 family)